MTDFEQYKEHIEHTFNAYCKVVILHAAIDEIRRLRSTWEREISFDYLTEEKFYPISTEDIYFAEPEQRREYPVSVCGQTIMLNSSQLAPALPQLPEQWLEMLYLRFFQQYTYKEIGRLYGRNRTTISAHIRKALRQLYEEMEAGVP